MKLKKTLSDNYTGNDMDNTILKCSYKRICLNLKMQVRRGQLAFSNSNLGSIYNEGHLQLVLSK